MKVALAQINTVVGDIAGNAERIRAAYARAAEQGADILLTPELGLPGYPPADLLDHGEFLKALDKALRGLVGATGKCGLVIGTATPNPAKRGRRLCNSAVLAAGGKIVAVRHKTLLPTYDVFDEARYFEPAKDNKPLRFRGLRLGLSVCEDAWNVAQALADHRYAAEPLKAQAKDGAELFLNIAASPFARGKAAVRRRVLAAHAKRHGVPLVYCQMVGGDDELIFDGRSCALNAKGKPIRVGKAFAEDHLLVDPHAGAAGVAWPEIDDLADLRAALTLGIADYARKTGFSKAFVGLSGGIDSALTCALAVDALGKDNVVGVAMPSMHSSGHSVADAQALAGNLGLTLLHIPIKGIYDAYMHSLAEVFGDGEPGLAEQNLQARIRGGLLMALANKNGALLLSTGNKSELAVGYCTLYGDMCGALAPLADVWKSDVYALARHVNAERAIIPASSIAKPPSAELAPDQRDQDDLPPYAELDAVLKGYVEEGRGAAELGKIADAALVRDLLRRVDAAEFKRRQAAPALRVSHKAFGVGRRLPIARGSHREKSG